jgi:hypothetical protein
VPRPTTSKLVVPPRGWHRVWGPVWGALKTRTTQISLPRRRSTRVVLTWLTQAGWVTGWSYRGNYIVVQIPTRVPPGKPKFSRWNRYTVRNV